MIPYLLGILGGYMIGYSFNGEKFAEGGAIDKFDTSKLDVYERMVYNDMIKKGLSKQEALTIIINQVEGDFSQLSPELREIAETLKYAKGGAISKNQYPNVYTFIKTQIRANKEIDKYGRVSEKTAKQLDEISDKLSSHEAEIAIEKYLELQKEGKTYSNEYDKGGSLDSIALLNKKIRKASKTIYEDSESNVVYLSSNNKISIGGYDNLTPYAAQSGNEVKVSFVAPDRTMLTFSNVVETKFEDRKSFDKYGGVIYIYEPLTKEIAGEILSKVDTLKKYADGGIIQTYEVTFQYMDDDGVLVTAKSKPIKARDENEAGTMLQDVFEAYEGRDCDIINVKKI